MPRPRVNLVTYHGVLAPAASFRERVVPNAPAREPKPEPRTCERDSEATPARQEPEPSNWQRRYSWAELMQRVYEIDVLTCQHCGGRRKVLEFLTKPSVVRKILEHLGLPPEPPATAPARGPPEPTLPYE